MKSSKNKIRLIAVVSTGVAAGAGALIWAHTPINFIRPVLAEATQSPAASSSQGDHAHATTTAGTDAKFVTKYTCPMHPQIIEDHPGTCPICGMDLVAKQFPAKSSEQSAAPAAADAAHDHARHAETAPTATQTPSTPTAEKPAPDAKFVTKYTCPMHPQIIEDHPGTCPICGMTLVPKLFPAGTKDNTGSAATTSEQKAAAPVVSESAPLPEVAVAPRTLRDMNVVMARAQWRNLTRQIHSVGLVALDENRLSHVHPRASGWVETLNVRALGDTVKKGETLLTVYSPDILSAEKDFLVALKSGMPEMRDAARDRLRLLSVPESVIEQIARTGKVARTIPVLAPQSGYISVINLRDGMYVTPNLDMFTIADASKIWVQVEVLPRDMEQVAVGQPAEMTVDGVPGRVWKGTVDFIYPELDPKSRTLKVRLVFDNPDGVLKPNQFAEVGIRGVAQADVLTVPTSAVIPTPQGARVVRKNADGSFQPVRVDVGQSADGWTQITAGLSPDDRVVASGQFLIDSESSIQASFARMTGTAQPADDAASAASGQHQH
ncbi:efflux RND transporter periplasmic adaptor subunit [Halothiobacillus sp.]|uniref:efflux RND transporter periplasmic adaptor subunit n=1 Tax=Halothiobacillus sp. TaxID=1891311 RepID=UPI002637337C|nr:efflux RND transporter periplasmic adaptor subunit [Halothiobacillus sp.]MDD4966712.1 efflux RND transporter periplasmic adaptor subunit [Halothiobacillus sp.]